MAASLSLQNTKLKSVLGAVSGSGGNLFCEERGAGGVAHGAVSTFTHFFRKDIKMRQVWRFPYPKSV
jgi:hypothetical protein